MHLAQTFLNCLLAKKSTQHQKATYSSNIISHFEQKIFAIRNRGFLRQLCRNCQKRSSFLHMCMYAKLPLYVLCQHRNAFIDKLDQGSRCMLDPLPLQLNLKPHFLSTNDYFQLGPLPSDFSNIDNSPLSQNIFFQIVQIDLSQIFVSDNFS